MRFAFTDDQLAFREAVADLFAKRCTPDHVRAWWGDPQATVGESAVWHALAEMGVIGCTAPGAVGGLGFSLLDLEPLLEEAGRAALPEPLVDTTAVALHALGGPTPRDRGIVGGWLDQIVAGELAVAVVGDRRLPVPGGETAGLLLALDGDRVVAIPGDAMAATPQPSVDGTRHLATVTWDSDAEVDLAVADDGRRLAAELRDRGAVATAAVLLGLGDTMLAMTVAYVTERRQFGVPVGSFQAVKHHLADALLRLELAKPVVRHAAAVLSGVPTDEGAGLAVEQTVAASMAKAAASDAAALVARQALQCHGAIGYTVEHDLHLFMKRSWALAESWGGAAWHRERIARQLLD